MTLEAVDGRFDECGALVYVQGVCREQSSRILGGCTSVNFEKVIDLFVEFAALPPLNLPPVDPDAAWNDLQSCDEQPSYGKTYVSTVMAVFDHTSALEMNPMKHLLRRCKLSSIVGLAGKGCQRLRRYVVAPARLRGPGNRYILVSL